MRLIIFLLTTALTGCLVDSDNIFSDPEPEFIMSDSAIVLNIESFGENVSANFDSSGRAIFLATDVYQPEMKKLNHLWGLTFRNADIPPELFEGWVNPPDIALVHEEMKELPESVVDYPKTVVLGRPENYCAKSDDVYQFILAATPEAKYCSE